MVKVTWLGHAFFRIDGEKASVLIDPFVNGNPMCPVKVDDLKGITAIVVTHYHGDHYGDCVEIAKRNNAPIIAIHEIAVHASKEGAKSESTNYYGKVEVDGVIVHLVPAWHSSEIGSPAGAIVKVDKKTIYHAGDTGLFYDMKLIGEIFKPDLMMVPIGGRWNMNPELAAIAVSYVKPKIVIPMHYNTFPPIEQDPEEFKRHVKEKAPDVRVAILKPGESVEI